MRINATEIMRILGLLVQRDSIDTLKFLCTSHPRQYVRTMLARVDGYRSIY